MTTKRYISDVLRSVYVPFYATKYTNMHVSICQRKGSTEFTRKFAVLEFNGTLFMTACHFHLLISVRIFIGRLGTCRTKRETILISKKCLRITASLKPRVESAMGFDPE